MVTSRRAELVEAFGAISRRDRLRILKAELARRSLAEFLRQAWRVHHPREDLIWGWHIDAMIEHLEAVSRGEIKRLIINVPPRCLKSYLVSVAWPAWEWIQDPALQYIATSAIDTVVLRDARHMKELVSSPWYIESFRPGWRLSKGQDSKGYYANEAQGHRISRTTGQRILGSGADRIIVDDPIDAKDAFSDKKALRDHVRYFDQTLTTRLNSDVDGAIVVVMQRLHERDLSGHLIEQGGYEHVCLPAEYAGSTAATCIGWTDPRTEEGELLFPERLTPEVLAVRKKALGTRGYQGQFQQSPATEGGTLFKEQWIQYWMAAKTSNMLGDGEESGGVLPEFDYMVSSWDTTFRRSDDSDYVCGQVWGVKGSARYLVDQVRAKMPPSETLKAIKECVRRYPMLRATIVETKATGRKMIARLKSEIPSIIGFDPQNSSKEERANAVLPVFEAGNVYLPHPDYRPWIREHYLPELLAFPLARHDDQVDCTTQALIWIDEHGPVEPWVVAM